LPATFSLGAADVQKSRVPKAQRLAVLMNAAIPALGVQCQLDLTWILGLSSTYKTPILIATATPNFSFFINVTPQKSFHGMRARHTSITPEYASPVISYVKSKEAELTPLT